MTEKSVRREPLPIVKTEIRVVYGALSGRLFMFLVV